MSSSNTDKHVPMPLRFIFGGLSTSAALFCVYSQDTLKTRIQMSRPGQYTSTLDAFRKIVAAEGMGSLYKGLSAAFARQFTYGSTRLGVFACLQESYANRNNGTQAGLGLSMLMALAAGGLGAVVGVPADLVMIRMQADRSLPPERQRNYTGLFNGIGRVVREEGYRSLWRGSMPTVARAIVINVSQLSSYSQAKRLLLQRGMPDGFPLALVSGLVAGFVMCACSLPLDMAKTTIQSMKSPTEYSGMWDVIVKTIRTEGFIGLWKGFTSYYLRFGTSGVLIFVFLEQMNSQYISYVGKS